MRVTSRAIGAEAQITNALASATVATAFPTGNPLADQLKMVARLIAARTALGSRRQVFFVSLGGFDLHDNLMTQQPVLLGRLSTALNAFHNATVELGVADKVTAFTASDFGRTLSSNGDGSDHGWGSHHFVVGGAVRGQAFYGSAPPVSVGNTSAVQDQWHVGQGRLLPSTSVDQYAATLARWFGVADGELAGILPNLRRFGADRLLASRAIAFDANPPSEDFAGVYFDAFVAVSPDDELVAPLGKATRVGFDVAAPDDPSWEKWAEEVMDSSQADRARSCVDPKA